MKAGLVNELNRRGAQRSSSLSALVVVGLIVVVSALIAGQTYLSMLHHGHSWWRLFVWQLASWTFWGLVARWIIGLGERGFQRSLASWLLRGVLGCLVLVPLQIAVSAAALVALQPFQPVDSMSFVAAMRYLVVPWAFVDVLVVTLLIATGVIVAGLREKRLLALRESRLEGELARAQLAALRGKLQPHFLFNVLNSIASLIRKRSNEEALNMVVGLGELLRTTLERSEESSVSLREELDFIERYVNLHRMRFPDRLGFRSDIDERVLDAEVPTLLLQPLVENAIRHGIAPQKQGGTVQVTAGIDEDMLVLAVDDDGAGLPREFSIETHRGVGLESVQERLSYLAESVATLSVRRRNERGTSAEIRIPLRLGPPQIA